jgi:soluble lytic murein transglycosylase-like protein
MVAESKCTNKAISSKGARGYWQLMSSTSRHYGCSDPDNLECATRAAAKYLKRLSDEFRDFNAVIAAYNMGGHNYAKNGMTDEAHGLVQRVNAILKQDSIIESSQTGERQDG